MTTLFELGERDGARLYAVIERLPERDFLDYLDSAGDDLYEVSPVVAAPTPAAALELFSAQDRDYGAFSCEPALATELPALETAAWTPSSAATCGVYRASLSQPEALPRDNFFLWDVYRALYAFEQRAWSGPAADKVAAQELSGLSVWGCELGQSFTYLALDRSARRLHVFNEPTELNTLLDGGKLSSGAQFEWSADGGQRPFDALPAVSAFTVDEPLEPSLALYRILAVAFQALGLLLDQPFLDGAPETPSLRFSKGQPAISCELFLCSSAEINQVLGR